eukprot:11156566-Lingulodinium_polyedra.AAC.1
MWQWANRCHAQVAARGQGQRCARVDAPCPSPPVGARRVPGRATGRLRARATTQRCSQCPPP